MRLRVWARCDAHSGAAVLERFTCPGLEHDLDALVHDLAAIGPRLPVRRVLARSIPDTTDDGQTTLGHEIDDGDVLGDAQRIVQRHEEGGDGDRHVLGSTQDGGRHREGRGTPAVVGSVMLLERHHAPTEFIQHLHHVEHGVVAIGHLIRVESRLDAVEAHHGQCH